MPPLKKIKVKATEMANADVQYISLVDRAASRMPIRILKRHGQQEIDLANLGTVQKQDGPGRVTAVAVMKPTDATRAEIEGVLKAEGFKTDKVVDNNDGSVSYLQEDKGLDDATLIRLSDNSVVAVKGFNPYGFGMDGDNDFGAAAAANSFYQNIDSAMDTAYQKIAMLVQNAETPSDAAEAAGDMLDSMKTYVVGIISALPAAAFKMDLGMTEVAQKHEVATVGSLLEAVPEGFEAEKWNELTDAEKVSAIMSAVKGEGGSVSTAKKQEEQKPDEKKVETPVPVDPPAKPEEKPAEGQNPADPAVTPAVPPAVPPAVVPPADPPKVEEPVAKSDSDPLAQILAGMTALQTNFEAFKTDVNTKVDNLTKKSEDVENKLKGTVVAAGRPGDNPLGTVTKAEEVDQDPRTGNFDTAFIPRRNTRKRGY